MSDNDKEINNKTSDKLTQYFVVNSAFNFPPNRIATHIARISTNIAIDYGASSEKSGKKIMNCRMQRNFWEWYENDQFISILYAKESDLKKLVEQGWYSTLGSLACVGSVPEYESIMDPIVNMYR
jgi:hypothetical protein